MNPRRCRIDGCRIPARRRGLCVIHRHEPTPPPAPRPVRHRRHGQGSHIIAWLDADPLIRAVNTSTDSILSALDCADRRAFYRAVRDGVISDVIADRIAVHVLGRTLDEIYGPNWDDQEVSA